MKKKLINLLLLSLIIITVICTRGYYINNFNALGYKADSIENAKNEIVNLQEEEIKVFSSDFQANFVEDTSYIIDIEDQIMYGQGYYMTYNVDQNLVYCVDPLTTATRVINVDDLTNPDNTKYSKLSVDAQTEIKQIVKATEDTYNASNDPIDLVAGQMLVWEASGADVIETSSNVTNSMEVIEQEVTESTTEEEIELNYYDTSGQDLVGDSNTQIPSVTIPGESNDGVIKPVEPTEPEDEIELTATNGYGQVGDNNINYNTFQALATKGEDDLSDQILIDDSNVNYQEQGRYNVVLTIEGKSLNLHYYVLDDVTTVKDQEVNLYGETGYVLVDDKVTVDTFGEFGFYIDENNQVIDLEDESVAIEIVNQGSSFFKNFKKVSTETVGEYTIEMSATYNGKIGSDIQTLVVSDQIIDENDTYVYGEDIIVQANKMSTEYPDFSEPDSYKSFAYNKTIGNRTGDIAIKQSDVDKIDTTKPDVYPVELSVDSQSKLVNVVVIGEGDTMPIDGSPYIYGEDIIIPIGNNGGVKLDNPETYNAFAYDSKDGEIILTEDNVDESSVDINISDQYPVKLSVKNTIGLEAVKEVQVEVSPDLNISYQVSDSDSNQKVSKGEELTYTTTLDNSLADVNEEEVVVTYNLGDQNLVSNNIDKTNITILDTSTTPPTQVTADDIDETNNTISFNQIVSGSIYEINFTMVAKDTFILPADNDQIASNVSVDYKDEVSTKTDEAIIPIDTHLVTTCKDLESIGTTIDYQGSSHTTLWPSDDIYYLGKDIDCSETKEVSLYGEDGFNPINNFSGQFYGEGYTVDQLYIDSDNSNIGLFSEVEASSSIDSIGLTNVDITGKDNTAGLVGSNLGTITNTYTTGVVNGINNTAGLVGSNDGTIENSYSTSDILGELNVAGLVGVNRSQIKDTYATGDISSITGAGLIGSNIGIVENSFSASNIIGTTTASALIVENNGTITNSYGYELQLLNDVEVSLDTLVGNETSSNAEISSYSNLTNSPEWYKSTLNWDTDNNWSVGLNDGTDYYYPQLINLNNQNNNVIELPLGTLDFNATVSLSQEKNDDYLSTSETLTYTIVLDNSLSTLDTNEVKIESELDDVFLDSANAVITSVTDKDGKDISADLNGDISSGLSFDSIPASQTYTIVYTVNALGDFDIINNTELSIKNNIVVTESSIIDVTETNELDIYGVVESCKDLESIGSGQTSTDNSSITHNNSWTLDETYYLLNDIDCSTTTDSTLWDTDGFDSIGDLVYNDSLEVDTANSTPFSGQLNGNGMTVSDLYSNSYIEIYSDVSNQNTYNGVISALFPYVTGEINNLNFTALDVNNSYSDLTKVTSLFQGELIGYNSGNIESVNISGDDQTTDLDIPFLLSITHSAPFAIINDGQIINSTSSIGVTNNNGLIDDASSFILENNEGATIENSYSTGNINLTNTVPSQLENNASGLVLSNSGEITNTYATGDIENSGGAGGLVMTNTDTGIITNSYSAGDMLGSGSAGGLVKSNSGEITNSYSTSNVTYDNSSAGLVNSNSGNISKCYAIGDVIASDTDSPRAGGLSGTNSGTIENCFATGNVTVDTYNDVGGNSVGGLVGENTRNGVITNSYAYEMQNIKIGNFLDQLVYEAVVVGDNKGTFEPVGSIASYTNLQDPSWYQNTLIFSSDDWLIPATDGNFYYPQLVGLNNQINNIIQAPAFMKIDNKINNNIKEEVIEEEVIEEEVIEEEVIEEEVIEEEVIEEK